MKTCPYCGSNIEKMNQQQYYCDFCTMTLAASIVKENRERLDVRFRDIVFDTAIEKTTPELMVFSTFELLYLLKMIRNERSNMYSHMHVFHRAGEEGNTEFKEVEKETGRNYMYYTKKGFIVENIIRARLGYVPTRITENYLVKYLENIEKDKNRPMIIRTERQKKVNG
ncbi:MULTISPECIES: hypothetical protein [Bacillaceae]|uniref:Uncharacterized protein n=1 Tax=Cytobacillus purgationiresistens TaxID=863449 RepID=A0ABU0AL83_9BACI|nr:hypothetical protein [Cytobacillus purgationiresistens]MDQ0271143.1 hypothetical protein [Cytobacillus purgationiresistens]